MRFTRGVMFAFSRNRLVGWYLRLIAAPSACWISCRVVPRSTPEFNHGLALSYRCLVGSYPELAEPRLRIALRLISPSAMPAIQVTYTVPTMRS